jgi:hypothetical protein
MPEALESGVFSGLSPKKPRQPRAPRIPWPILATMSGGLFLITFLLLWFGAVVAVRCDRVAERVVEERLEIRDGVTMRVPHVVREGRVDVTAERRVLGLLTVRTERLPDVVRAISIRRSGGVRRAGASKVGPQLQLKLRDGGEWESFPAAMHVAGTPPGEMAERIQEFLDRSSAPSLRLRWIPWVMSAFAVPFLLACGLFAMVWMNMLRRALGWGGPA